MRCDRIAASMLLAIGACAAPMTGKVCTPVSSWAAPAYRCVLPPGYVEPKVEPPVEPPPIVTPPPKPEAKIELREKVEFETDSAVLLPKSSSVLDEVVTTMKDHSEIKKVRIEGHTDSTSTPEHNQTLSEQRAASVKEYLVKHGIAEGRLTSQGFGQTKPIASNDTEEGRSQNRRVEVYIVEKN